MDKAKLFVPTLLIGGVIAVGQIGAGKVRQTTHELVASLTCAELTNPAEMEAIRDQLREMRLAELREKNPYTSPVGLERYLNSVGYDMQEKARGCER